MRDVVIIGCGIIGAAAAYELSKYELAVTVLEKENDVSMGATKANSAIIHAGYDPEPGTLMARLNVEGSGLAKQLCGQLNVPHRQCGSLVLAFSAEERLTLERLFQNGEANGVDNLEIINKRRILEIEPNISENVAAALYAPSAMIIGPWEYALALAETAVLNKVEIKLSCMVENIEKITGGYRLGTSLGAVESRFIINAAGVYADKVHNMVSKPAFQIFPKRGEYYLLDKSEGARVGHVIFQCPTDRGKGVLVAPTVHGNLIAGPNSEIPNDCQDVSTTIEGLETVRRAAQKSVPGIDFRTSIRNFSGNRAQSDRGDFIIEEAVDAKGFIDLAGIKSPGLSAAPAVAKMAVGLLQKSGLVTREKRDFQTMRKKPAFSGLAPADKAAAAAQDPAYGHVICRCETVTEGEIRDALESPIPPRSVDGIKRRVRAGMGRCQGGFCGPRVLSILSEYYKCTPLDILQDGAGTYILTAETKNGGETRERQ